VKVRRYHMRSWYRLMPDRPDSMGNGTRTLSARFWPKGGVWPAEALPNCHSPLRLSQSERTICGRGYSGKALEGVT